METLIETAETLLALNRRSLQVLKGIWSYDSSKLQKFSGHDRNVGTTVAAAIGNGTLRPHGWTGRKGRETRPQN